MFELKNIALYAKHFYERSDNIFLDIQKCLEADGYLPMNCEIEDVIKWEKYESAAIMRDVCRNNIITILVNNVSPLIKNDKVYFFNSFIEAIDKKSCWKYGYYHNEFWGFNDEDRKNVESYNYETAIVYFFLSIINKASKDELGWCSAPKPNSEILPLS